MKISWSVGLTCVVSACSLMNQPDEGHVYRPPAEVCNDNRDNDENLLTDCDDPACVTDRACPENDDVRCSDGLDNNSNGLRDCEELGCKNLPLCSEASDEECMDGADNDKDTRVDCDDPVCAPRYACFAKATLTRVPKCTVQPGSQILESFDEPQLDSSRWVMFSTGSFDRSHIESGALDLDGRDNFHNAGIYSVRKFVIGTRHPFALEVRFTFEPGCEHVVGSSACHFEVHFHTREQWGDESAGGASVLGLIVTSAAEIAGTTRIAGYYRGAQIEVAQANAAAEQTVRIELDPETSEVLVLLDGSELFRFGPLADSEPAARLVLSSGGYPRRAIDGRPMIEDVQLTIEDELRRPACEGRVIGEPIIADNYCGMGFYNTAMHSPRVARTPDASDPHRYHLLFAGTGGTNHTSIGHAFSSDGRSDWTMHRTDLSGVADASLLSETEFAHNRFPGGFIFNEEASRFEAWIAGVGDSGDEERGRVYWAPLETWNEPDTWTQRSALTFDGELPRGVPGTTRSRDGWFPKTVIRHGGKYYGWYDSQREEDGHSAIFLAASEDGITWTHWPTVQDAPVLIPDQDWEFSGVTDPSVDWTGEYFLMAYTASTFGVDAAVGLAVSRDGIHWEKHTANPVLRGSEVGFDDVSASRASVLFEGNIVRLWYTATANVLLCGIAQPERLGLVELALPGTSTVSP